MKMSLKATVSTLSLATLLIAAPMRPAEAAIPVIDTENIAQQIKTYLESVKVVTNTAQQITLQLQELKALPHQLLEKYWYGYKNAVEKEWKILENTGILAEKEVFHKTWDENFPILTTPGFGDGMGKDYTRTAKAERNATMTMIAMRSLQNEKDVLAIHELMQNLEESRERLQDLLEQNKIAEGAKQTMQLSNQIATERAHIESIHAAIVALSSKKQITQDQHDLVRWENQRAVSQAMAEATDQTIHDIHAGFNVYGLSSAIDNPYERYGRL